MKWELESVIELAEVAAESAMSELAAFGFIEPPDPFYEELLVSTDEECLAFLASRDERREAFGATWM